jgi:hypothetical protein
MCCKEDYFRLRPVAYSRERGTRWTDKDWAKSVLHRLNFTKREATKGIKHLPDDFDSIKSEYLAGIEKVVKNDNIPDELIQNWDQTGVM